ncbi:hypothetical protein Bca4012_065520 [Brassica carinata]
MTIIKGFASNPHSFWTNYFFVQIDSASVVESWIPIFRSRWGRKVTNPFYRIPEDLHVVRNLLGAAHTFGDTFPRNESSLQWLTIILDYDLTSQSKKKLSRTWTSLLLRKFLWKGRGQGLQRTSMLPWTGVTRIPMSLSILWMNCSATFLTAKLAEADPTSHLEARTSQFKAEAAEKEVARLKEEAAANSLRKRELPAKEARRAYRKGEDREEVGVRIPCEDDEVNQLAAPSEVNDCLLGRSMSGYYELDP